MQKGFIAGGNYRIDSRPTECQLKTFELATSFHKMCLEAKIETKLGCIVNDLGG